MNHRGVSMETQQMMQQVLTMLESLPANEVVQGVTAKEAAARLRESISTRARILAEQAIYTGQGGHETYRPIG